MPIKVGFLIGKDFDVVEDPKYVGDASFLEDLPDKYRVDPESKKYLKDCKVGTKGFAHADVAIPWYVHKHYDDIQVDLIFPEEVSLKRLRSNLCNFIVGWDLVSAGFEGKERRTFIEKVLKNSGNCVPDWPLQDFVNMKSKYLKACIDGGVPVAPTIFYYRGLRTPAALLQQIKERGWKTFVMKQSLMAFSLGVRKLSVEECERNPKILKDYFKEFPDCPEYVVQEAIEGFARNWETRCFWWNGKFVYAIANQAAVSTADGVERIVTGNDIPDEFLEGAKKVGRRALQFLPQQKSPTGQPIGMTLIRTDIGCSDTQIHDKENNWDPKKKTFFLNEVEYMSCAYFIRHLKKDTVPTWAKLFAEKIREIHTQIEEAQAGCTLCEPEAKRAKTEAAVLKKPAAVLKRPASAQG